MDIRTVGVVGGGFMGSGIAEVVARHGYPVVVREINDQLVEACRKRVAGSLERVVERGRLAAEDAQAAIGRLQYTTSLNDLSRCDLVIEAIVEVMAAKRQLFQELDQVCQPDALFASNTSSLSITEMAAATKRSKLVGGLHFFSPVPVMPLVEISQGLDTDLDTVNTLVEFAKDLGKTPILAKDTPAFVVNRLLVPYLLDAARCYEAGLASREDIDAGIKLGLGHPMGPLALIDFIGVDVVCHIADTLFDAYRDPRFAPPPLLRQMVHAGRLGRKSGAGFYHYQER
jgi:3-hydroxybutyryl-CoA dehydrogenase